MIPNGTPLKYDLATSCSIKVIHRTTDEVEKEEGSASLALAAASADKIEEGSAVANDDGSIAADAAVDICETAPSVLFPDLVASSSTTTDPSSATVLALIEAPKVVEEGTEKKFDPLSDDEDEEDDDAAEAVAVTYEDTGKSSDESLGAASSFAPDAASAFASCSRADSPTASTTTTASTLVIVLFERVVDDGFEKYDHDGFLINEDEEEELCIDVDVDTIQPSVTL